MDATAQQAIAKIALPSDTCDRKTYQKYVEARIVESLDFDECRALMAFYNCAVEELVGRIVADRFAQRLPTPKR